MLAVLTVSNLDDTGPGSLRDAIDQANLSVGTPDDIVFQAGLSGTINIGSQLPSISDDLTITGENRITIDAGGGTDSVIGNGDGYRLLADGSLLGSFTDSIQGDPLLGPLADNGGPTLTHALLPGSPALDAGNIGIIDPPMYDQRGVPFLRIVDGNVPADVVIDIGAYEAQAIPTSVPGDYNRDGTISLSDYTVWRNNLGASVAPLYGADGDGNGVVDHADYRVWRGHFGITYAMSAPVAASPSGPVKSDGPGIEAAFAKYKSPRSSASTSQPSLDASDPTSRDVADQAALLLLNRAESESEPNPPSVESQSSSATSGAIELALELDWDEI